MSGFNTVTHSFTATGQSASFLPFNPGFNATVSGTFVGTVRLERSFDGGSTWHPLTAGGVAFFSFTAPASESGEELEGGVLYRWNCTAYTSGTIVCRLSQ